MPIGEIASLYARIGADISGLKRGLNEAKGELQGAQNQMQSFGDKAKSTFASVGIALGVVATAAFAAKQAFDFIEEGAQLELVRIRFNRLAEEIGTTGDLLQNDLRNATQGLVSDTQAMASATDFMSLGLAKTSEQAIRLTRVAALLGMNMNQLVLTLTNQTTMRFDQLGVAVDGFDAKLEALKRQGLDTNAAFTEAFLQQAERQIERVGSVANTTAGDILILKNAWVDFKNSLAVDAAETAAPVIRELAEVLTVATQKGRDLKLLDQAFKNGTISAKELDRAVRDYNYGFITGGEYARSVLERIRTEQNEVTKSHEAAINTITAYYIGMGKIAEEAQKAAIAQNNLFEQAMGGALGTEIESHTEKMRELSMEAETLRVKIAYLAGQPTISPEQQAQLDGFRQQLDTTTRAIQNQALQHQQATRQILIDLALQRIAQLETTNTMDASTANAARSMVYNMARAWGLIDEATYQAATGMDQALLDFANGAGQAATFQRLNELQAKVLGIQGDYYINFVITTSFLEENPEARFAKNFVPPGARGRSGGAGLNPPIDVDSIISGISGIGGGGGGGGGIGSISEIEKEKLDPGRLALQIAQAVSQIGSTAAGTLRNALIDPLQKEIEAIDKLVGPGFIDVSAIDRTAELEQRRAEAAERVAEAQEKILALEREQQRLQFLESQVRLLDLIKENGLDAQKILGGVEFGADTDPLKIVEATTRALQDLIAKSASQLGVTVPTLETDALLGRSSGGDTYVTVEVGDITNRLDMEEVAYRVADVIKYRT